MEIIKPTRPVVFVNTDTCSFKEELNGKKLINKGEAETLKRIVASLLDCGLTCKDIGVICPYRNQLKVLKESVNQAIDRIHGEVEIETIDKYQVRIYSIFCKLIHIYFYFSARISRKHNIF